MPLGANSVTSTKPRPSSTGHQSTQSIRCRTQIGSGACPPVNQVDRSDTKAAPITAP
jgi:hypothetical protein